MAGQPADTKARLSSCWELDIQWDLYPEKVKNVRSHAHVVDIIIYAQEHAIGVTNLAKKILNYTCRLVTPLALQ